ncbi:MAG: hypothetical protein A2289_11350 [Deltaproteobacteria bacterium RIFOXYA12_FULL_58_15]|nr:MAG: hypothetical protein A2289_11350 [Deltaproteobacteria bacterium RIFOXYA12_FULL_58_15]OGR07804.1 MAG: hypothetical protein A2341_07330 [Deltaproteobacteria bacterium RIFOXYB12_FULL_58_9]
MVVSGCGSDMKAAERSSLEAGSGDQYEGPCGGAECPVGFHCEFDQCVIDEPPTPPSSAVRDPLASKRYVFTLDTEARRLVRIDSLTLEVEAFAAGLAPMVVAVVGSRELSVLLDGLDIIEVLDHRTEPPVNAAWSTARSLSHLAVSPTGDHAIAYYDWDDHRAQDRQSEPGNINQISVLSLADGPSALSDDDPRLVNVAVGFLPRDVRFSEDGSRAIVISRDTLTPITLTSMEGGVAEPRSEVAFDGSANEILIDADAHHAVLRYAENPQIDVIDLESGVATCLTANGVVTDMSFTQSGELVVSVTSDVSQTIGVVDIVDAAVVCAPLATEIDIGAVSRLSLDPSAAVALAYEPALEAETIWVVDLQTREVHSVRLEKAVLAVAWVGDGEHAHLSHMKMPGAPAWDPMVEDPEVSVDKSYGVSWLNVLTNAHRLEVSDQPFGPFVFVPALGSSLGVTFQAILDDKKPEVLRVSHRPGFDDRRIALAAEPERMGYLSETRRTYITQSHPWGRITFVDPSGEELRHVTGFALEVE